MRIYCIPGLGFDHRIFQKLDLPGYELNYLDWVEPLEGESFRDYAGRMASGIIRDEKPIVIIGHSLGGMIGQEMACLQKIDRIFLVSSIKTGEELPFHFDIVEPLGLYKMFTRGFTLKTFSLWGKSHGYESEEEQELFRSMVGKSTDTYLQWALRELSLWQTPSLPERTKLFHIHGENDKTFPLKKISRPDYVVPNGSHFMVYKQPELISRIVAGELGKGG